MAKINPVKTPMREQPPEERIHNYDEVPFGYSPDEAVVEAQRCLMCKKPVCISGCPVEIDIPGFIQLIAEKKFKEGINLIKEKNILPAICGRVCPQEEQCELKCVMGNKYEPVAIGRLERFLADWEAEQGLIDLPPKPKLTGKRIAVIGAGPAGITAAADLVRMGHVVDMFEALHQPGGVLVYGIPEFRLPKEIVFREINYLEKLGVRLFTNHVIGKIKSIDDLRIGDILKKTDSKTEWEIVNMPQSNFIVLISKTKPAKSIIKDIDMLINNNWLKKCQKPGGKNEN